MAARLLTCSSSNSRLRPCTGSASWDTAPPPCSSAKSLSRLSEEVPNSDQAAAAIISTPSMIMTKGWFAMACTIDFRPENIQLFFKFHSQPFPVWPNPPAPRALASKSSTISQEAWTTGTNTNCAIRMPGSTVKGVAERFQHET